MLGLGEDHSPAAFGNLAFRLPEHSAWRTRTGRLRSPRARRSAFAWAPIGYTAYKQAKRQPARLLAIPSGQQRSAVAGARPPGWCAISSIRPANLLGPVELAEFSRRAWQSGYGAAVRRITDGDALEREATRPLPRSAVARRARPHVAILRWSGSAAHADAPLLSLCGKGVCFDTGGYDIKPSAGMLRMKKDMGGAATVLGLARMIMEADLPVRLAVRIGCVENSVSGHGDAAARRDPHADAV